MLAGGGSAEIEVALKLYEWSRELSGMDPFIVKGIYNFIWSLR